MRWRLSHALLTTGGIMIFCALRTIVLISDTIFTCLKDCRMSMVLCTTNIPKFVTCFLGREFSGRIFMRLALCVWLRVLCSKLPFCLLLSAVHCRLVYVDVSQYKNMIKVSCRANTRTGRLLIQRDCRFCRHRSCCYKRHVSPSGYYSERV
jgi:hypothetical protein